ncbi:hypothetical protein [Xylanibacillus composti]|uniref:hypothetical protein n=1 Tax=Xylanibacillus composti TaxID=1572762 RepID=UPI001FD199F3|nr:hypothetical protein [Xylanibacillus composti]
MAYWFFTIYWVAVDQRCTAYRLASVLQLHYRTALRMLHVIRAAMRVSNGRHMLSSIEIKGQPSLWTGGVDVDFCSRSGQSMNQKEVSVEVAGTLENEMSQREGHKQECDRMNVEEGYPSEGITLPFGMDKICLRDNPLIDRCRNFLLSKAENYIRTAYRRVSERHRQRYVDEFFYQWLQRHEHNPFQLGKSLLRACGTLVYQENIQAWIRPVFSPSQTWSRKSAAAHPDQAA